MGQSQNQDVEELRAQRAALADFGSFAFHCDDLDALLQRAADLVSEAMDVELVKILEHLPERGELLIRAGVNWQPGVVGHVTFADQKHSPGGYALQTLGAVASPDTDAESRFQIPQVLVRHDVKSMVNVIIAGSGRPFGVLEVDAREKREFGEDAIVFLRNYANLLAAAIARLRLHESLRDSAGEQRVLAQELRHRVKNLLGVVRALVSQTTHEDRSAVEFKDAVLGRLRAFAAAEDIVFEEEADAVDVGHLARTVLAPFGEERSGAIEIQGPPVRLPGRSARMLGLALHELATNASKHGALSLPAGRVCLRWRHERGVFELVWSERGGPEMASPERRGFGTRLLEDILPRELRGTSALSHHGSSLEFRLTLPTG